MKLLIFILMILFVGCGVETDEPKTKEDMSYSVDYLDCGYEICKEITQEESLEAIKPVIMISLKYETDKAIYSVKGGCFFVTGAECATETEVKANVGNFMNISIRVLDNNLDLKVELDGVSYDLIKKGDTNGN